LTTKRKKEFLKQWSLTHKEELSLHNLKTKKFWFDKNKNSEEIEQEKKKKTKSLPEKWGMLENIQLYDWQKQAVESWFKEKRGTIKVVTGAGKTILALAIIEKLQRTEKDLCVAIVVPTIVLLNQWHEELLEKSNLPEETIGFLGAGHKDNFKGKQKRVILCVLNTASKELPNMVDKKIGSKLLLIIDECHHAGALRRKNVFKTHRSYVLGLSATPERDDFEEEDEEERDDFFLSKEKYAVSILGKEIGPIVYELSLKQAYELGILPGFEIRHYGLLLTAKERVKYDQISKIIKDLNSKLKEIGKGKNINIDRNLWSWCQNLSKKENRLGKLARLFIQKTRDRKDLLYNAKARGDAVVAILEVELKSNPQARAILFHERIEEVMNLYNRFQKKSISIVAENSNLSDTLRETSIDLFRRGIARVIVSARSLIEGFNVPSADIGIIVASSTSVRQRIQTLGRMLRKTKVDGKEKKAIVYVLYMQKTTDENIYEKTDWIKLIGAERNRYFSWDLSQEPVELKGPPREPPKLEEDIEESTLEEGGIYLGRYDEGVEYSCDSRGNVFDERDSPAVNPQGIPEKIFRIKKGYGRFKVTLHKKYVLLLKNISGNWQTYYVSKLIDDFNFERVDKPGEAFYFKQKGGQYLITKKHPRGELYARIDEKAEDKNKGKNALEIINKIQKMQRKGIEVDKFFIDKNGQVKYLENGELRNIIKIKKGLEFPEI
jgi:superfamily II DNA or RNA helicase